MSRISARLRNSQDNHQVSLQTNATTHAIQIPPRAGGRGSSANGGELLCLALATCFCNDIYREAARQNIDVESVEVEVFCDSEAEGAPVSNVTYRATVTARASEAEIVALMKHTDRVAEIHNTLRTLTPVTLTEIQARPTA